MVTLKGKGVFGGIAIGKIVFYEKAKQLVVKRYVDNPDHELRQLQLATETVIAQLQELYQKAVAEAGEESALIFDIHQMMLQDEDFQQAITRLIREERVNAAYAVSATGKAFAQTFAGMDDDYMKERASDVQDIVQRLVDVLCGGDSHSIGIANPAIVAAEDLTPSETIQMDKRNVLAFVTKRGSVNSHTAILARTMSIPAVVDVDGDLNREFNGELAIVDGFTGAVYIRPDEETLRQLTLKKQQEDEKNLLLQKLKGQPSITLDGRAVCLYANIGDPQDIKQALENDAEGIGLFRSEFLYLGSDTFPSEEQQFIAYKQAAQAMNGKKVIIRTLDIGADKQVDYFQLPKEENPALGYRAIRICLTQQEIFETQLRAIYRASAFGNLGIMFPMIIAVEEVVAIKAIIARVQAGLDNQGIRYSDQVELGIMIETPAAVVISDLLAKEVAFFSIGTNDLTQYTLAIDRQNPRLDRFYNPHHTALVRMIETVVENAHANGIWVGICGELGADSGLTEVFLEMGVDELSVSPAGILALRNHIRKLDLAKRSTKI